LAMRQRPRRDAGIVGGELSLRSPDDAIGAQTIMPSRRPRAPFCCGA
jgi:hypothetical protein